MSDRRYFFIHVMKTAGTTLAWHLRREFPKEALYPSQGNDFEDPTDVEPYASITRLLELPAERRNAIRVFTGHFPYWVSQEIAPDLHTFTVLRDPIDRTVSVLKHFKRLTERFHELELEEIYDDEDLVSYWIRNHQTKVFSMLPSDDARTIMRPIAIDEERFERAKTNLANVEIIGLTESFNDVLAALQREWGWWPEGLDRDNQINTSPESWNASPELRQRIAEDNPFDIAFYRFAQDLVARRAK